MIVEARSEKTLPEDEKYISSASLREAGMQATPGSRRDSQGQTAQS
jgi:hypothetical protein